jgi:hypothetical protein
MIGQNMMRAMTKEDAIRISNYRNQLVPLSAFRKHLELRTALEDTDSKDELTVMDNSLKNLRLCEKKAEERMAQELINSTLQAVIKSKKKK